MPNSSAVLHRSACVASTVRAPPNTNSTVPATRPTTTCRSQFMPIDCPVTEGADHAGPADAAVYRSPRVASVAQTR